MHAPQGVARLVVVKFGTTPNRPPTHERMAALAVFFQRPVGVMGLAALKRLLRAGARSAGRDQQYTA